MPVGRPALDRHPGRGPTRLDHPRAGVGLWAVADAAWVGYELAGSSRRTPGPADVLYFLGIAVVGSAWCCWPGGTPQGAWSKRVVLDTLVLRRR